MSEAPHDLLPGPGAPRTLDGRRPDLRASDADRDATAARLGGALAVGCLTSTEYAERLDATYAARTTGLAGPPAAAVPAGARSDPAGLTAGRARPPHGVE